MRKMLLTLPAIFFLLISSYAQNRTVTGKVTDDKGLAVQGASVLAKGTKRGSTTNAEGVFSVSVPANARTLVISGIGFGVQEVAITDNINVALVAKTGSLEEVVVTTFGVARKKRDEAGAITTVGSKQIENKPFVSFDKALQGQAAGVLVQANNGIPGGAINVRIRGAGSINAGNSPLYIVDGLQLNTRNDASFTQSNPLAYLNPDDIQSIDVIKDAASAAIYGSNAANGVVIITTKKGRVGKTRFTLNTYFGSAELLKKLETTNSQQYFQLRTEATFNANNGQLSLLGAKRNVLTELRVPGAAGFTDAQADSAAAALPTYSYQDAAFRKGSIKNYELSASGGNEKTTFRISANFTDQSTVISKADFKRYGLKADITNKATDRLTFGASINLSTFNQNIPFATDGSFLGSPAFSASGIIPAFPIYNADGTFYGIPGTTPFSNLGGTLNQNVIAVNEYNTGFNRTNQLIGNINTDYKITSFLSFKTFAGIDYRLVQGKRVTDPRTADGFNRRGAASVQSNWNTNIYTYGTLNFNKIIGERHKIDSRVGYEYRQENNAGISATGEGFPTFQFTLLQNAATPVSNSEFFTGFRRNAVFGDLNYSYNSKYILGLVGRYDGSSRFGSAFKHNIFYGVKAAWNVDQERFLTNSRVISSLRLRASYGTTGNDQIGNFDALGLFGSGGLYNGNAGLAFSQLANPNLKFEKTALTNLGMDLNILQNRLRFVFEVYDKQTSDVLLDLPLQSTTGFSSLSFNVGKTQNRGVEASVDADLVKSRRADGFNWNINFNFAYNEQKVKELFGGNQFLPGNNSIRVGQPISVVYTQKYAGVNVATGRPIFLDTLGNITYIVNAKDRVVLGPSLLSPYYGGMSTTFSYKGFSLSALASYEYGRYVSDGQVNFLSETSGRINFLKYIYDNRFTAPGQLTSVPRQNLNSESKSSGAQSGDRTFFKADYIRLRNVELAYTLSASTLSKLKFNSARFYVQGTNLYTYSDARSYDVEFVGTATGIIPQTRNFTVGLQLGF